jgi:hypothetical protein
MLRTVQEIAHVHAIISLGVIASEPHELIPERQTGDLILTWSWNSISIR